MAASGAGVALPLLLQELIALLLGGFVAGHVAGKWQAVNGAVAAGGYILALATVLAFREATQVRELGLGSLPPLDLFQLAFSDVIALTAASAGGWLASLGLGEAKSD
jgi:hypothetical protein